MIVLSPRVTTLIKEWLDSPSANTVREVHLHFDTTNIFMTLKQRKRNKDLRVERGTTWYCIKTAASDPLELLFATCVEEINRAASNPTGR